ncbi:hypothetical protein BCR39DRAFT_282694 [Naematelia encephala]|uniref:CCHC-type domain-containing protein n=1 Tax=Naematelia encephala TaxID=71784 RepID=A0A1Y2AST6_9TREE|nr:hypothetical protein BCR39DRAFT_282694 [Naematelia encephala]
MASSVTPVVVLADCPSMRGQFGQKCYNCGRFGHIARLCPGGPGGPGGFNAGPGGFRGRGGFAGGRPRPIPANADGTPVKCYRCNGENHLARDCLAPRDEATILASKKCYKCQELGHLASLRTFRDCPQVAAEELPTAE